MSQIEVSATSNPDFQKYKPSKLTGEAKWKDIEDLINRWARRNPQAAMDNQRWVKEAHAELKDKKYGKRDDAMGRFAVSIHPELMNYIQAFYPRFMDTKEDLHEFMKRFPKFKVPTEV